MKPTRVYAVQRVSDGKWFRQRTGAADEWTEYVDMSSMRTRHWARQWPVYYGSITEGQGDCRVVAFDLVPVEADDE